MAAFDTLRREVLQAARSLRRTPLLTAAIVLTLAIGIGVNTTVFGIVNALLLRPLPVRDASRLVVVASHDASGPELGTMSLPDIEDYRAAKDVFVDVAGYGVGFLGLAAEGAAAQRVLATTVTGNYFELLGLEPAAGRLIAAADTGSSRANPIAVLGYSAWQRRFGGDPGVVGSVVRIDGRPCTIIGIAPRGFPGTFAFSDSELYLPLSWRGGGELEQRDVRALHALARLNPGVSVEGAQAVATSVAQRLAREHPDSNSALGVRVVPERLARPEEDQARSNALGAALMLALGGFVSVLSAVNVANLLLARVTRRRHELGIRAALGAGRGRLVLQLVGEISLLAVLATGLAAILSWWLTGALATIRLPGDLPVLFDFGFDGRVLSYVAALTLLTGLIAGLPPAMRAGGASPRFVLGVPRSTSCGPDRLRSALAVSQIALSYALLVAAALFSRSLLEAERADLGFRAEGVLNVQMDVAQLGYTEEEGRRFFDEIARRVQALPGVERLGFAFTVPLGYVRAGAELEAEGATVAEPTAVGAGMNNVSPGYFSTLAIPIVRGRELTAADDERAPLVAVVNERLAEALWPVGDALGRRFKRRGESQPWIEVVGVVGTGKYESLFETPQPFFYVPQAQAYTAMRVLHVRTALAPDALLPTIERVIRAYEPDLALYDVQTLEGALGSGPGLFPVRVAAAATAVLGALAFALAMVGTYAVVSYITGQRTHEIAVRVAVGSSRGRIMRLVLANGAWLVVIGLALGAAIAISLGRALGHFLFGVSPHDPGPFALVGVLLAFVALAACTVPAWRAARVDPTVALRGD